LVGSNQTLKTTVATLLYEAFAIWKHGSIIVKLLATFFAPISIDLTQLGAFYKIGP